MKPHWLWLTLPLSVFFFFLGKKILESKPALPEPAPPPPPAPPPVPPAPAPPKDDIPILDTSLIKDGDKVLSSEYPGKELPVLFTSSPTNLVVAIGTPFTDPANQVVISRASVLQHIPRKR